MKVSFEADDKIKEYFNVIPVSLNAGETSKELIIPLIIEIEKDGKVLHTEYVKDNNVSADKMNAEYEFDFSEQLEGVKDCEIVLKAAVFDRIAELKR